MSRIPLSALVERPPPGLAVPSHVKFSPNGEWIAWLHSPDRSATRQLFFYDVASGELRQLPAPMDDAELTEDEKLRRQRLRDFSQGVSNFSWTKSNAICVTSSNSVATLQPTEREWNFVLTNDLPMVDPQLSPDETKAAWVQDGDLWLQDNNWKRRLRDHGPDGVTHGLADYIAQEEMSRMRGFWWAPDNRRIAFTEVDERDVPVYRIVRTSKNPYDEETHRYPFAGGPNATTKLFVIDTESGEINRVELGNFEYLARVTWAEETLYVQTTDRAQKNLCLHAYDTETRLVLEETSDTWINLHSLFRATKQGLIWASERSGFMQLQLHEFDGREIRKLSASGKNVYSVDAVEDDAICFTADGDSPRERRAYRTNYKDNAKELTHEPGTHCVTVHDELMVDVHDDLRVPPRLLLRSASDGSVKKVLFVDRDPRVDHYDLREPKQRTLAGEVEIDVTIFEPDGEGPFPTLVYVYGGPHVQLVRDTWAVTAQLDFQYLRERGVCVVVADGRGSANRGKAFETEIANDLGNLEVQDQASVVERLIGEGLIDGNRLGVTGASYGGYMTLMCLAQRPDLFRFGVAQALVSHWDSYDTHYTERYMGLPDENAEGYERSSLMHHIPNLQGELLLVHGMIDENVHFRHMARLINSLIEHQKPYQLLLYPNERHGPVGERDRLHMKSQINQFILDKLEIAQ